MLCCLRCSSVCAVIGNTKHRQRTRRKQIVISEKLQKVIETLLAHGEMRFFNGATEAQIVQFDKENGIELPKRYKEWLLFSDGGECFLPAGIQLYGVAHDPTIDINDADRPDENFIVIGRLSSGDPIVFRNSEERISIYNREAGKIEADETYTDFSAFLKAMYDSFTSEDSENLYF